MYALTRAIPDSFVEALSAAVPDEPIHVGRARQQHLAYEVALAACGVTVQTVAAEEECPDCVFVEDTAVIVAEGYPRTHEALDRAGFVLHPVPVTEVRKADGSLTCQSLLFT